MIETNIIPGIYQHYKGERYEVIGVGLLEATEEPVVVYKALYQNDVSMLWVRPLHQFEGTVEIDGKTVPRFVTVDADEDFKS